MRRASIGGSIGYYAFAVLCGVVMILPFLWTLSTALTTEGALFFFPPSSIPKPVEWDNFVKAWSLVPFPRLFVNSIVVSTSVTLLSLALCGTAAFAFARLRFRGSNALFVLYLSTLMIPTSVTLIPSFIVVRILGWLNTYAGLIVPAACAGVGFGTFLLRQFYISIPRELDEAAWMDGAGAWRIFLQIVLPLGKPALVTLGIYTLVTNWNNLLWALVVISKEEMKTLTLALATMTSAVLYIPPWNQVMAATLIGIVPVLLVFVIAQRYFIQAMTLSGLKG